MEHRRTSRRPVFAAILACALVFSSGNVPKPGVVHAQESKSSLALAQLFRATVKLSNPTDRARLDKLGIKVLSETSTTTLVLVDDDQLATLARLRFEPDASNSLDTLISAQKDSSQWLAASLQPLMQQVSAVQNIQRASLSDAATSAASASVTTARATLQATVQSLSQEQAAGIAASINPDSDGDGLTDTQEQWWCTDPLNPDTDNDNSTGTTNDYQEVQQAKDWLANRRASPPAGGPPFAGWPMVPGDGHYNASCVDRDRDGVPDAAETWDLGLNPNNESTDGDKFDDGQELFGITPASWGLLPRTEDVTFIGTNMPSWVKSPGNHPLVAAYPEPQIDVVQSSFVMKAVTTVTTEKTVSDSEEHSYSTAKTEGNSTSQSDTVSWSDYQEATVGTSTTTPVSLLKAQEADTSAQALSSDPTTNLLGGKIDADASIQNCGAMANAGAASGSILGASGAAAGSASGCANIKVGEVNGLKADDVNLFKEFNLFHDIKLPDINLLNNFNMNLCLFNCGVDKQVQDAQHSIEESSKTSDSQDRGDLSGASNFRLNKNPNTGNATSAVIERYYPVEYPVQRPTVTQSQSKTQGHSVGGAKTTTTEHYEENTVTNGQQFGHTEGWSTATAVNSAHAADFWFAYTINNSGTDYLLQLCNLAFNVYIGNDTNPAYTYFVAPDVGGDGCFHNYKPGDSHTFSARTNTHAIPLNLDEMKAIDLGEPVRVVLADYSYGTDQLFYSNARGAGVLVGIEDGTADGDEIIDNYLIPTWGDGDTMQDVIGRYFPSQQDSDGNYTAIWTPEYRTDTPSWCVEPKRNSATTNQLWCKHALSTSDWWNIYLNNLGDGTAQLKDTPAAANSTALFRFNQDSDLDGYSDRTELKLGTDPQDAASHPKPELIAGVNSLRNGSDVTSTLSLLNTGFYDAYGVESVMIAPDDSISIVNNTVGGSGRVRALKSVVVGSSIKLPDPLPTNWTQSNHAQPVANGYYIGGTDRVYTFTAQESGNVSTGTLRLTWTDGAGASGALSFGTGYLSPTPQDVGAYGVKVGLYSGSVSSGEVFTVTARTPRDTFQYHINREPHSEPIVVVSYNDPQGNHRFVVPPTATNLSSPTDDLMAYSGQMWQDPGVEIVTTTPITTQSLISNPQSLTLVVNNPTGVTLSNAHLFVEFVNISGTVASEVPVTVTLPAGPSVVPVTWRTAVFSPTFQTGEDYIVMAFLTDYQGNILDTAGRPLSSFQADPKPVSAMAQADETWNFGTAKQGTLLKKSFTLANTGLLDMLTYVNPPQGVSLSQTGSRKVGPADMTTYEIALNTTSLPLGAYDQTITLRTSDADRPTRTVHVTGTVVAGTADAASGSYRPLDVDVTVTGNQSQGTWWTYTHTLGPDPASLHPIKVYSQDYATFWGMGKYATDFAVGTAPSDMFGDGRDGALIVATNTTNNPIDAACTGTTGAQTLNATNAFFAPGQRILIHQTQGTNAGQWERNTIQGYTTGTITLATLLKGTYTTGAQVLVLMQYTNVTINNGVTWTAKSWNGTTGGILAFLANGSVTVNGTIYAKGQTAGIAESNTGFRGGQTNVSNAPGQQGEGLTGTGTTSHSANGIGGGGGGNTPNQLGSGAGGGGGIAGGNGSDSYGGASGGSNDLTTMTFGGGGGAGGCGDSRYTNAGLSGGGAGGIIYITGASFVVNTGGLVTANGGNSYTSSSSGAEYPGGGGGGGSILLKYQTATLGSGLVTAQGGTSATRSGGGFNPTSGTGGNGRIRIEYCTNLSGSTNPPASTQKLNCYITEQIESSPYNQGQINLPENVSGSRTYKVQYGRRLIYTSPSELTTTLRVPSGLVVSATLDMLVSGVPNGPLNLSIDVGNDGVRDWQMTQTVTSSLNLNGLDLASAFNTYWSSHGNPLTGTLDVPLRVSMDQSGQVLLTNLQMQMSTNNASVMPTQHTMETTVTVTGTLRSWVTYTHSLGPDPHSLHPVKVYTSLNGLPVGVGNYATDFATDTLPAGTFGDGRDDDLVVSNGQTTYTDNTRTTVSGTANAGQSILPVASTSGFTAGEEILIIQMQGTGAGSYEFATIASVISPNTLTLQKNLNYTYLMSGNSKAQVVRVPHYRNVVVRNGGVLTAHPWDSISTGGIVALRASSGITIEAGGSVNLTGLGFHGGVHSTSSATTGQQGESPIGVGARIPPSSQSNPNNNNGSGGGGGLGSSSTEGAGGGGAGYKDAGVGGGPGLNSIGGAGGNSVGESTLTSMYLGSGGGAGGNQPNNSLGADGGNGGGALFLFGSTIKNAGSIVANGVNGAWGNGCSGAGGGGAGGSLLLSGQVIEIGDNLVSAAGGAGGGLYDCFHGAGGGNASAGRIRIQYCDAMSGSTSTAANTQKVNCYIAEQVEYEPYNAGRLNLPDTCLSGCTYTIQYGRRITYTGSADQVTYLRVPAGLLGNTSLQVLISDLPASTAFGLDIGNDGTMEWNVTIANASTNNSPDLSSAFNSYWSSHGAPSSGVLDIPVRVSLGSAGQVLLTNLQTQLAGSPLRYVRLTVGSYTSVTLNLTVNGSGTVPVTIAADVGDDGSIDWQWSNTTPLRTLDTANLSSAINTYLTGKSGDVDVPVRFYLSPASAALTLNGFSAIPAQLPDVAVAPAGITFSAPSPVEADVLTVTATVNNVASINSIGMVASFFAVAPEWGRTYIGSAFVPTLPASGSATASVRWDTTAFTGSVPVSVVLDPLSRVAEVSKANNAFTTTLNILTRPDLRVLSFTLSDAEPVVGELVTATVVVNNAGQTVAPAHTSMLYLGNPDGGGIALGSRNSPTISGGANMTLTYSWVPTNTGQVRLFARIDQGKVVNESNRNNNADWLDVYVGMHGPVKLDSGTPSDTAYTSARGYGYLDEGQPDQTETCGTSAYESLRRDPGGRIVYRFDNLQPGHFYHLDTTFFECDGAGRQQYVYVDGNALAGPEDLSDGRVHRLSLRLDPALYADRTISVTIVAPGIDGAVVNEVNLYDVDYRYADAGGGNDPQYTGQEKGIVSPYGWLTTTTSAANTSWGSLPYQSVRISQGAGNNAVRYRFDGLSPSKQYQVQMTLWQSNGAERIQKVQIDGVDVSASVNTGDYQQHLLKLDVPAGLYASDGSVIVSAVRTNAATGAFVNEIALEELTSVLPPIADFSATPITGFVPLNVQFTDLSSGAITTRTWNFGDGNSSAETNPAHLYSNAGIYTVSLAVSGPGGDASLVHSNFITVSVVPSSTTVMRIAPTTVVANVGTPLTVSVDISNVTNLGSFEFSLAYNPSLVQVQAVSLAEFPGSTGRSFGPVGPTIDNVAGTVSFGAMSLGSSPAGPNGTGRLAYVRLLPLAAGTAGLHLSGTQASDIQSVPLSLITQDGSLTISANKGDFDGDGDIDILDVQRIAYRWGTHTGDALYSAIYDMDSDGDIDILDVQYVAYRWGTHFGASMLTASIPDSSLAAAQTVSMSVRPANGVIFAGQSFTASVVVSNVTDLGSFQFTLGYSPTAMQVLSITLGTLPGSTGRTFMTTGPIISATNGNATFGAFSLGTTPAGANGNGAIAIVTMKALTASQSSLALQEVLVSDRQANSQSVVQSGASVRIIAPKQVYLPVIVR